MRDERGASLWAIDTTLHQLIELREEPGIADEERAAIDQQIVEWTTREVEKVDRVRGFIRACDRAEQSENAMSLDAEGEMLLHKRRAAIWASRRQRMKDICVAIMEARGVKKLEGEQGRLRVQPSGGKQALKITRPDLVPDEYRTVTIKMCATDFDRMMYALPEKIRSSFFTFTDVTSEPDEKRVRVALDRKCAHCGGSGFLTSEQDRKDFATASGPEFRCAECNGTGHQLVPGAELEPRGSHLRVE